MNPKKIIFFILISLIILMSIFVVSIDDKIEKEIIKKCEENPNSKECQDLLRPNQHVAQSGQITAIEIGSPETFD